MLCVCVLDDDNDDDMQIAMENKLLSFYFIFISLANHPVLLGCASRVDSSRSGNKIGRQYRSGTKTGYKG